MRILYLADIRFPLERANGIQTVETCHALASRGHDVTLRVRHGGSDRGTDPLSFYGLVPLPRLRVEFAPSSGHASVRRAAYVSTAVLQSVRMGQQGVILTRDLGVAAALVRLPRAVRPAVVYESHGFAPAVSAALPALLSNAPPASRTKLARLERREHRVWKHADGYVTITRTLARELEGRFGTRRVTVVPDGVRLLPSRAFIVPVRHSPPVVGYAGHLYPWKGVDLLLLAIGMLPAVRGLIVGGHEREPDLARLRQQAETLGISERVRFTGFVPPADVAGYLSEADVLVLPNPETEISRSYSSPLKLFEYMAAGKPIVASDLPAFREVLSAEDAVLVEPGSASALAAAIEHLLADPQLASRLASNAFSSASAYSWSARAARLERVLAEAVQASTVTGQSR